jgi:hypothetical protein
MAIRRCADAWASTRKSPNSPVTRVSSFALLTQPTGIA